ncbi:hypothetical protein KUCAC02_015533 [Chaenocephalus aceratus]|uniref:Uncharacterized protein n=1 Tax=Chaenocephalus aceratus TaxID=36190 RepID=A0ACB9Y020_CHAAC|nr:hypothetical protein KUCAC02_015533 [Chaenocephalus aceratus]
MWGTAPRFISLPSSDYAVYSVLTLLFIASPSEHPSRLIFIIAYILSDPSPPFQLAAAGEESQEKRGKRCGTKLWRAHVFLHLREAAKVSSCRGGAEDPSKVRGAALLLSELQLDVVTERQRAEREGSRAQSEVPQAASNEPRGRMALLRHVLLCVSLF